MILVLLFQGCTKEKILKSDDLLYYREEGTKKKMFRNNLKGTAELQLFRTLETTEYFYDFDWGPDGKIYVVGKYNTDPNVMEYKNKLYSMESDGTNLKFICYMDGYDMDISRGGRILYGWNIVYSCNLDGSDNKKVIDDADSFSWHPDGTKIIYSYGKSLGSAGNIFLANADGTGKVQLTQNAANRTGYLNPYFSPDGGRIVYTYVDDDRNSYQLTVSNVDGSRKKVLFEADYANSLVNQNWTKDGRWILAHTQSSKGPLYLVKADGDDRNLVAENVFFNPIVRDY